MVKAENQSPQSVEPVRGKAGQGEKMAKTVLALAMLKPDGTYLYGYSGDNALLMAVHGDQLRDVPRDQLTRKFNSKSGDSKKARDNFAKRLEKHMQGEADSLVKKVLRQIRSSDPRHGKKTNQEILEMILRENPRGRHQRFNEPRYDLNIRRARRRTQLAKTKPKPSAPPPPSEPVVVEKTSIIPKPPRYATTRWGFQNRNAAVVVDERADVPYIRNDSVTAHPLWPKRQLKPFEKLAYALSLPGEDGKKWLLDDLRSAVANLNAARLLVNEDGQALGQQEGERKLEEMTQGSQMVLDTYFTPVIQGNIRYFEDPTAYVGVPDLAKNYLNWVKYMPRDNRPSLDDFLARLRGKPLEVQDLTNIV